MLHVRPVLDNPRTPDHRDIEALKRKVQRLEDENQDLKSRLAAFAGGNDEVTLRCRHGLTPSEASIFLILARRGFVSYDQIQSAIYTIDKLETIEGLGEAIRSHMKRLRKKVRPLGLDYSTIYGVGWSMSDAMRSRAKAMLAGGAG